MVLEEDEEEWEINDIGKGQLIEEDTTAVQLYMHSIVGSTAQKSIKF